MLESGVPIKAILFDLGRVIVDVDTSECEARLVACSTLERDQFLRMVSENRWIARYERGEITTHEFHELLSKRAGLRMDYEDFRQTWSAVFNPVPLLPTALLSGLARRYTMTLVSNTNEAHADYIRDNYDVFDCFTTHVLSYQVGALKPESSIFQVAIDASQHRPESILFIDDLEENVAAGRAMGLQAHQFRSPEGLRRAFLDLGVEADWVVEGNRKLG